MKRPTILLRDSFFLAHLDVVHPSHRRNNLAHIDDKQNGRDKREKCKELLGVIVAAYDQIAYGAMKYARESGYRIPEDISFVGMDDISSTEYLDVPLSSIHVAYEEVCERIVDLVFRRIENRHYRSREPLTVPVSVKIRESLKNLSEKG